MKYWAWEDIVWVVLQALIMVMVVLIIGLVVHGLLIGSFTRKHTTRIVVPEGVCVIVDGTEICP